MDEDQLREDDGELEDDGAWLEGVALGEEVGTQLELEEIVLEDVDGDGELQEDEEWPSDGNSEKILMKLTTQ